jgi:dephospho-CoA kinase
MQPGGSAFEAVVQAFGGEILAPDRTIDRSALGAIVFRDPAALRTLESAVHPATIKEVNQRISSLESGVIVVEAIKLIESGMHRNYDALWVVTAPRAQQIQRLMIERGLSEEEAIVRVDSQPPQEEKAALADLVIVNDGDLPALREQVLAAWAALHSRPPAGQAAHSTCSGQDPLAGGLTIRPARRDDLEEAAGIAHVLNSIIAEKCWTALTGHWTPDAEQAFLQGLGPRSEVFAAASRGRIVGFQAIDPFAPDIPAMDHVATLGTYVLARFRKLGIGGKLFAETLKFARAHGYEKAVVHVLAGNEPGLAFYRCLGFETRGVLKRQTKIDDAYHDEILMELDWGTARA